MTTIVDPGLFDYCTERQRVSLEAIAEHGSIRAAARALGVHFSGLQGAFKAVQKKAALSGYSPQHDMRRTVPDGYVVKGVSTYYDQDGKPRGQWVKSALDRQQQEGLLRAAAEALASEIPRLEPIAGPAISSKALCTVYTLTDCHVGMRAWHKEGGADWDLSIAEKTLVGCFSELIASSPSAAVGVVNQLGDFLHQDSIAAVTPTSGHLLDADGRFSKVVQSAIRIIRRVVDMALRKHDRVVLLLAEGNHDVSSSIWLRSLFSALYENEPRVKVIDSELPYYVYQHGQTMLAFHHGHLSKNDQLPLLFAAQFPRIWGDTVKRYAHTGHRHHVEEKEHSGITVIQHPTLSARDAYAARGGWISERSATSITYHEHFGQVARNTVTPEMLAA